jgi:hypothetical protein
MNERDCKKQKNKKIKKAIKPLKERESLLNMNEKL